MSKDAFLLVVILLAFVLPFSSPIFGTGEKSNRIVNSGESIQQAINKASDGDTIHIAAGNYIENVIINKSVALVGENIDETIIDGTGLNPTLLISKVDIVKVENLTLKNSYKTDGPVVAGVRIWDAKNTEVTKCRIEQCEIGIELKNSTHCNITKNQIIDNDFYGIHLRDTSSHNLIYGNFISINLYSIWVPDYASKNNTIYYNNFVNNTNQIGGFGIGGSTWDNGYPSGGNYWSDYSGVDLHSGLYQNETGYDWIGDTPYFADNYPLTDPYVPERQETRVAYRNLLGKYNELLSDFSILNSTYCELLGSYDELLADYNNLNTTYYGFLTKYNSLNSSYTALQDSYDELHSDQEAIINELGNIQNLMYIFIATTITFIATTVYLAIRKPKIKP